MKRSLSRDDLTWLFIWGVVGTLAVIILLGIAQSEQERERARQDKLDALDCPAGQVAVIEEYEGQVYRPPDPGDQSFDPRGSSAPSAGGFEDATLERAVCVTPTP